MSQPKHCTHIACQLTIAIGSTQTFLGSRITPPGWDQVIDEIEFVNSKQERPPFSAHRDVNETRKNVEQAGFELISTHQNGLVSALAHSLTKSKTEKAMERAHKTRKQTRTTTTKNNIFSVLALKRIRCVHCLCAPIIKHDARHMDVCVCVRAVCAHHSSFGTKTTTAKSCCERNAEEKEKVARNSSGCHGC